MIRWDRDEWGPYFREIADRLNLREWAISIDNTGPGNPNAAAAVRHSLGRKVAMIDLSEHFLRESEDYQRHVAVHEILHLHHAQEKHMLESTLDPEQFRFWVLLNEYGHDAETEAIAPLMPLPSTVLGGRPAKQSRKKSIPKQ